MSGASVTLFVGLAGSLEREHASRAAGIAALIIAAAALIGWWGSMPMLSSWGPDFATMRPVAALCLAALGVALARPAKGARFAFAVGLAMVAVAAYDLVQDLFNIEPGIGRLQAPRTAVPGQGAASYPMPHATAVGFAFAGGSLALSYFERHRRIATVLGSLAGAIALFVLLAYLTGIVTLYGSASVSSPALPTAVGLLCVAAGIVLWVGTIPAPRKPRPLWHLLVVLGCAIIAPLLLFGIYAGSRIADARLDRVREDLMNGAHALSAEVDREIIGEIERLQALAASPSLRQGDFAEFQRQAEASLAMRQSGNIMLIDRNMQQLVNTWVPFGTPLEKAAVPEASERALVTGRPQVTGLFPGPVTKQLMFGIVVPVQIEGESRFALVRSPDRHVLAGPVAANELPPGWHAAVSDATHHIILRSEQEDVFFGKELPPAQWHRAGPDGVFEFTDADGRSSLEAYTQSELTGWETIVWEPTAVLEAPARALWWTIGAMAALAFALVVALALWLGRIIARSVGHAARAAVGLGEGRQLPRSGTPIAEINALMAELREAAARRQATEDLLRASEATFRAMFDLSSVAKIEVEPGSGRFLRANAAMCQFVGYSEAELLARTVYEITYPGDLDADRKLCRGLDAGVSAFDVEKRYVRKDGKIVWARTTVNVIRDELGRPLRHMAVIQDLDARKQAEQALQASKDRLQLALNAAQLGSWQYDPLRRVVSGDARAKEIFDVAESEAAIEQVMERVHPADTERVWLALAAALDPADPKRSATEFRLRLEDGEVRWVETLGLAYFEGEGRERRAVSIVGTVQDITERKEREEREYLLMREINHRAKNMLSVVHAIANQTAAKNPEDFIERFCERIQALSANQDLLVRNEWNGVEIEDLVRAQLAPFAGLIGSRIAVHGPRLRLKAASEQAIGLALHELATNAGKYGALSTDAGRVDIRWESDGDTFTMSWTEGEGPPASPPKRRGFGTIVMEAMVERSVDGTVDLDYAPSGLSWRLTCPAASALEPGEPRAKFARTERSPQRTNSSRNSFSPSEVQNLGPDPAFDFRGSERAGEAEGERA